MSVVNSEMHWSHGLSKIASALQVTVSNLTDGYPDSMDDSVANCSLQRATELRISEDEISWFLQVIDEGTNCEYSVEMHWMLELLPLSNRLRYVSRCECGCAKFVGGSPCHHCLFAAETIKQLVERRGILEIAKKACEMHEGAMAVTAGSMLKRLTHSLQTKPESNLRIQWRVGFAAGYGISVSAFEQKLNARGTKWSPGRKLELWKVSQSESPAVTPLDGQIASILRSSLGRYFEQDREVCEVLPLLEKHSNVVWNCNESQAACIRELPLKLAFSESTPGQFELKIFLGEFDLREQHPSLSWQFMRASFEGQRLALGDASNCAIFYTAPVPSDVAQWVLEVSKLPAARMIVKEEEMQSLIVSLDAISRVLSVELPERITGPSEQLSSEIQILLTPHNQGLEVAIRQADERLPQPLLPGAAPSEVLAMTSLGPRRLQRDLEAEAENARRWEDRLVLNNFERVGDFTWQSESMNTIVQLLETLQTLGDQAPPVLWPQGKKLRVLGHITPAALRVRVDDRHDWFGISGSIDLDGTQVSLESLLAAVHSGDQYVRIGDGKFATISESFRRRLQQLSDSVQTDRTGLKVARVVAPAVQELLGDDCQLDTTVGWVEMLSRLEKVRRMRPNPSKHLKAELREYQLAGYRWLAKLSAWDAGGILADDMGLGKTIQTLGVLLDRASGGPTLIVAPTSVAENWRRETEKFAPRLKPVLYRDHDRDAVIEQAGPFDLIIVSYALLQRDTSRFAARVWHSLVLDEAQYIKNAATKTARAARDIQADWRLALSGTPLENHLGELWSLMRTVLPGLLGSWDHFRTHFAEPIEKQQSTERRQALANLIQPFILRRTKSKVLSELPERTEVNLFADLSPAERKQYEAARMAAINDLTKPATDELNEGHKGLLVLSWLTRMRQLACHPRLVDAKWRGNSAKMNLLLEAVSDLREGEHRALVFSQFVQHLQLIREALDERRIPYQYLDGATPAAERQKRVDAFQAGQGDLFLISLKAGGTGLNLTAADYVIHLDPWWNPAVEDQATDRAHRIGQVRPVTVLRLIARDTIEEQILALHADKRELVSSVLDGTDRAGRLSTAELISLIRGESPENS